MGTELLSVSTFLESILLVMYDDFQSYPRGSSRLETHHIVGFNCSHRVPTNEFREAVGCLELLIQRQVQPWGILVSELDCLQHLVNSIPLQSFELTMRTDNGNFLRQLYGATFFTYEETPLTRSMPLWRRSGAGWWPQLSRGHSGLALGSRLHSPLLLRLAQREWDETNKLHTEGIQSLGSPMTPLVGSASRCTAQAFLQAGA